VQDVDIGEQLGEEFAPADRVTFVPRWRQDLSRAPQLALRPSAWSAPCADAPVAPVQRGTSQRSSGPEGELGETLKASVDRLVSLRAKAFQTTGRLDTGSGVCRSQSKGDPYLLTRCVSGVADTPRLICLHFHRSRCRPRISSSRSPYAELARSNRSSPGLWIGVRIAVA